MNPNVVTLKVVDTVENIYNAIKNSGHHGYPIVNNNNRAVGLIFSNYLLILIKNKAFYDLEATKKKIKEHKEMHDVDDPYVAEDVLDSI